MLVLLIFIGAGVFTNGVHGIQESGTFGTWQPESARTGLNIYLFDISECCGLDNEFWVMMRVLFGYQPTPTGLEWLAYSLYHVVLWTALFVKYKLHQRASIDLESIEEGDSDGKTLALTQGEDGSEL